MTLKWRMAEVHEAPPTAPIPVWIYVFLYGVIEIAAIIVTVSAWPQGEPTMTPRFWCNVLLLPLLIWIAFCGALYSSTYEEEHYAGLWWNFLLRERTASWKNWARAHLVLLDSMALTPEDELAERMLGLEGTPPQHPDKALTLSGIAPAAGRTRLEQVLERMLATLAPSLMRLSNADTFEVMLITDTEADTVDVLRAWRKLSLPGTPKVRWLAHADDSPMIEEWFETGPPANYWLVLACQLHSGPDAGTPSCSEAAAALLLSTSAVLQRSRQTLKPQAYLFRPIHAESDAMEDALSTLLMAGQVPSAKVRHYWHSRLGKATRHAGKTALEEAGLQVATHDLDHAMGKPGPINGWLLYALAGRMVRHGQGGQLVATADRHGAVLGIVGAHPGAHASEPCESAYLASGVWALAVTALVILITIMKSRSTDGGSEAWYWLLLAGFLLTIPTRVAINAWARKRATERFDSFYFN